MNTILKFKNIPLVALAMYVLFKFCTETQTYTIIVWSLVNGAVHHFDTSYFALNYDGRYIFFFHIFQL